MTRTTENAIELDRAIDTILRGPAGPTGEASEGELTATARLLRDALPRLHPRFSFEEHLAARLAAARRLRDEPVRAPEPTPIGPRVLAPATAQPAEAAADPAAPEHRLLGLVAGGAIASGVSIAGAAIVVWRRSRSGGIF
jgi:hypothetical protein